MGFLAQDFVPIGAYGPTATTPSSKDVVVKVFRVTRTDTTSVVKAVLPADASILDAVIYGVASDASTTATLNVGTTSAATELVSGQDVKTAGGKIYPTTAFSPNFPNTEPRPLVGDIQLFAKYAETGTASTVGGPWTVVIYYIR